MPWINLIVAGVSAVGSGLAGVAASEAQKSAVREAEEQKKKILQGEEEIAAQRGVNPNTIRQSIAATQQRGPQAQLQLGQLRSQQPGASQLGGPAPVQPAQVQPAQPVRSVQPAPNPRQIGTVR